MQELVPETVLKIKASQDNNSQSQSNSQKNYRGGGKQNRNSEKVTRKESLTNMFGCESEESTTGNVGGSGSYISQATSHLAPKSTQSSKLNLNKNKITASCKEYKNIDDEWLFHCDNIKLFEV